MRILGSTRLFAVIFIIGFNAVFRSNADTLYVDNKLTVSSTTTYSIANRSNNGKNGKAFKTIQMALDQMNIGDVICIRGGTYLERKITLPYSKNGSSWNKGNFNTMISYPGEWAILDGQKNIVVESGHSPYLLGWSGSQPLRYWKFERIEIRNGATADGKNAAGFFGNYGPFIFRYCVFRDNICNYDGNNPGAIVGYVWQDCLVEYCYFYNNGVNSSHWNGAHLNIFSDYKNNEIAQNGFVNKNAHTMGNTYQYNLFVSKTGPGVAIKYKNETFLTGRNPSGGHGYNDTYKNRGDHIRYNIFKNTLNFAVLAKQDFIQIYNNIFDSCYYAMSVGEWGKGTIYRPAVYNNTILGGGKFGMFFSHYQYYTFQERRIYHYAFNNIVSNCADDWNSCDITLERDPKFTTALIDSFKIDRNFIHRPATNKYDSDGSKVFWYGYTTSDPVTRHTLSSYSSMFPGSKLYVAQNDNSGSPFSGTSGTSRYMTRGAYSFSDGKTIANAGKNIKHPYLPNQTIPAYIGATNPNDANGNRWVSEVMNLVNLGPNTVVNPVPEPNPNPTTPTPVNNPPTVLEVSAGNGDTITDSIVAVKWRAQDDKGVSVCSIFVSINDASYKFVAADKNAQNTINYRIPVDAVNLKFMVRAYDESKASGTGYSVKYAVSRKTNQLRMYVYPVDANRIYAFWANYPGFSFKRIGIVYRTDRFANSLTESGNTVFYSNLNKGSTVLNGLTAGKTYYISIFGESANGWGKSCDNLRMVTNNTILTAQKSFSDKIYVPEDGSAGVTHTLRAFKGNGTTSVAGTVSLLTETVDGKKALQFTVPSSVVSDTFGFYAYLIRSSSKYSDTIRISKPVKRVNNFDNFVTEPDKRHPISVTADRLNKNLASAINYVKNPLTTTWTHNKNRALISQYQPTSMANAKELYYEYGQIADSFFNPLPGRLIWVFPKEAVKFNFGEAVVPALYQDYTIKINSRWSHFAMPTAIPVTLRQVMNLSNKVWPAMFDSLEVYQWRKTSTGYSTSAILLPGIKTFNPDATIMTGGPGTGFAVYNRSKVAKSISIPAIPVWGKTLGKESEDEQDKNSWTICLNARLMSGDSLPSVYLGYSPVSSPVYYQPAPSMDDIQLFVHDKATSTDYGHVLVNQIGEAGISFDVAVVNNSNKTDTIVLMLNALTGLPAGFEFGVTDIKSQKIYTAADSIVVEVQPQSRSYLTIGELSGTATRSMLQSNREFDVARIFKSKMSNDLRMEFYAPSAVKNAEIAMYTMSGQCVVKKNIHLIHEHSLQIVEIPLRGNSISSGRYILSVNLKDVQGKSRKLTKPILID